MKSQSELNHSAVNAMPEKTDMDDNRPTHDLTPMKRTVLKMKSHFYMIYLFTPTSKLGMERSANAMILSHVKAHGKINNPFH